MVGNLFDDTYRVIRQGNSIPLMDTLVSVELDLELPRGYVAKIKRVEMFPKSLDDILAGFLADDYLLFGGVLLRDPDDAQTFFMPDNSVEHDVICEYRSELSMDTASGSLPAQVEKLWDFGDQIGLDVITARNLRFNAFVNAPNDPSDAPVLVCIVYYTLEKVKDAQILEVLDIL